jgi:hypothetical protein
MSDMHREYDRRVGVMRLLAGAESEEWPLSLGDAALDARAAAFAARTSPAEPLDALREFAAREPAVAALLVKLARASDATKAEADVLDAELGIVAAVPDESVVVPFRR